MTTSDDGQDAGAERGRMYHAIRTVKAMAIILAIYMAGLYAIARFDPGPFIAAIGGIVVWEWILRSHTLGYTQHAVGIASPNMAEQWINDT